MIEIEAAVLDLAEALTGLYEASEAERIARYALEDSFGFRSRLGHFTLAQARIWESVCVRLLAGEPLQYVTGKAWFYGHYFGVRPGVLIPRQETEELLAYALPYLQKSNIEGAVLDMGTGSGCIAVSLALKGLKPVFGVDISAAALEIATENAVQLNAEVVFMEADMLQSSVWDTLPAPAHILSNPPYVLADEWLGLHKNVRQHEPAVALFVPPEQSPILFYVSLLREAATRLPKGGSLWCELHPRQADVVLATARQYPELETEILLDMSGRPHFLKAIKC